MSKNRMESRAKIIAAMNDPHFDFSIVFRFDFLSIDL